MRRKQLSQYPEIYDKVKTRNKRFDAFVKRHFTNLSKQYVGWSNLRKSSEDYDAFLCGSDQLWLPQNLGSHFYTLEFEIPNYNMMLEKKSLKESNFKKSDAKVALQNVLKNGEEFDIPFKYSDEWVFTDAIEDELERQGFSFENSFRDKN